jgi:hypothetical protein
LTSHETSYKHVIADIRAERIRTGKKQKVNIP